MPSPKPAATRPSTLLFADTEKSADQLYFGRVHVPDPFIAFEHKGKRIAIVSALEFNRVKSESRFDKVLALEPFAKLARESFECERPTPAQVIMIAMAKHGIEQVRIPYDFPSGVALDLVRAGVQLEVADGLLFAEREFKEEYEANEIARANRIASECFSAIEQILAEANVKKGLLYHNGKQLTSESLKAVIGQICLAHNAERNNPIVACGDQACDPHCRGSGPISARQLIIVDIFPRLDTGYHGDMTRTYIKGKATPEQRSLVEAVLATQQASLSSIVAGKDAREAYEDVVRFFQKAGFKTQKLNGVNVGFFHGLGHGLGLEVHEPPRLNNSGKPLLVGQVVTVEPGLYYPGLGGCRFEDVLLIGEGKSRRLSEHPYNWEIR